MGDREGTGRGSRTKSRPGNESESTLRRWQARGEQLINWVPELGKTLLGESEPGRESILAQVDTLRGHVSKRAKATGRDIEARAERLLADLEDQALRRLQPVLARANVASRAALETLERRLAHIDGRIGPLLDDRAHLSGRMHELEQKVEEARADASERLREIDVRIANGDELRNEVAGLRERIDTLGKEHVARSLEFGRLHDRVVRLEMRFGDFLKEHGTFLADHEDVRKRVGALGRELEESTRDARRVESSQIDALTRTLGDVERTMQQMELRLGDLAERHTAALEEAAALTARIGQLELTTARPSSPAPVTERAEGH